MCFLKKLKILSCWSVKKTTIQLKLIVFYFKILVHGGGFIEGTAGFELYNGKNFASNSSEPVVLVSIQYRLGVFGFLTDGQDLKGNQGHKVICVSNRILDWIFFIFFFCWKFIK